MKFYIRNMGTAKVELSKYLRWIQRHSSNRRHFDQTNKWNSRVLDSLWYHVYHLPSPQNHECNMFSNFQFHFHGFYLNLLLLRVLGISYSTNNWQEPVMCHAPVRAHKCINTMMNMWGKKPWHNECHHKKIELWLQWPILLE